MKSILLMLLNFMIADYAYCISDLQILRVGSYNIKKQVHKNELSETFKTLQGIQILGLQEVAIPSNFNENTDFPLISGTEKFWPFQCLNKTNFEGEFIYEGQAILSHFPITNCGHFNLKSTDIKKRIAQWAVIKTSENKEILFVNTDHETNNMLTLGFPDRKKQLLSLIEAIKNCKTLINPYCNELPVVLVGDLNTLGVSLSSPIETFNEVHKTEKLMSENNFTRIKPCPNQEATFHSIFGHFELDHIFIYKIKSESCRYSEQESQGSDHLPIWSTLKI